MDGAGKLSGISAETLRRLVDEMYDEVLIYDDNYNIVYINQACIRHYGHSPDKMIGKSFYDFVYADWWGPSILPTIYKEKRAGAIRQSTFLGAELLTIAVPIFDENGDIQYVVMNVRDSVPDMEIENSGNSLISESEESVLPPVAESAAMKNVTAVLRRLAPLDNNCIFWGESGVGKTTAAQYLHSISSRREQTFATMDCVHLADDRLQEELFGVGDRAGLLYRLRNGTLLLKEITEMSPEAQAKLLRYLNGEMRFRTEQKARLLVSSKKSLKDEVLLGHFNQELYYRLGAAEVYIPPLRARREDIRPLIERFWGEFCSMHGVNRVLTDGAKEILTRANWLGNVMELRHAIESIVVMTDALVVDIEQLPGNLLGLPASGRVPLAEEKSFDEHIEDLEAALIRDAYQSCGSSRKVAKKLGISQTRANHLIQKYIRGNR